MRNSLLVMFYFLLVSAPILATITKFVDDDAQVIAQISQNELNRVFVHEDRIARVFGLEGGFVLETDEETGQIFIKPSGEGKLHLTLITEKGKSIDLLLTPKDIAAETIALRYKQAISSDKPLRASNHVDRITELVKAMVSGKTIGGYERRFESVDVELWPETEIVRIGVYQSKDLRGEIYRIKNSGIRKLSLKEKQFAGKDGVAAVALSAHTLNPNEEGRLFLIKKRIRQPEHL